MPSDEVVWTAPCASAGALKVHIHLGDGTFVNSLAGQHQLTSNSLYKLRVRFQGDAAPAGADWSDWAERTFITAKATVVQALLLSDISVIPSPRWQDDLGNDIVLPAGSRPPVLRLEVVGGGTVLELAGLDGTANRVTNPPALSTHGPVHVVCEAGSGPLSLPASRITFTDGSGQDREIFLPQLSLFSGLAAGFWVDESGGTFTADAVVASDAKPDFTMPVSVSPVPWALRQPGFRVERFATGFQLPVNVAFVPNPGPGQDDPFFYVTELYGTVKMVTRGGQVFDYATGLLNFDPDGQLPRLGGEGPGRHRRRAGLGRPVRQRRRGRVPGDRQSLPARHASAQHRRRAHHDDQHHDSRFSKRARGAVSPDLQPFPRARRQALRAHRRRPLHHAGAGPDLRAWKDPAREPGRGPRRQTTRSTTPPTGSRRRTSSTRTASAIPSAGPGAPPTARTGKSRTAPRSIGSRRSLRGVTTSGTEPTRA